MTKSTITRELVHWLHDAATEFASTKLKMTMKPDEVLALTGALLASMDTEPVGWTDEAELRDVEKDGCGYLFKANPISPHADPRRVIKLYRHAQPAQVVPEEATPDSIEILASGRCRDHVVYQWDEDQRNAAADSWNACRAAMLQASPVCTCPSGDGSLRWPCPVHPGNSPAQSDCCPAQNSVNPAQGGNYLVIPDEITSEQAYEIGYYYGDPVDVFARGANWMRQHIIDSTLAAAPQSPGSEPATVPGKWIPVSEQMPESNGVYFGWDGKRVLEVNCFFGGFSANQFIHGEITHWMPLPAPPTEVK